MDFFDDDFLKYKIGYENGGRRINKQWASYASDELKMGNGKPMAIYNKVNNSLNKLKDEIEEELRRRDREQGID